MLRWVPEDAAMCVLVSSIDTFAERAAVFTTALSGDDSLRWTPQRLLDEFELSAIAERIDTRSGIVFADLRSLASGVICRLKDADAWPATPGLAQQPDGTWLLQSGATARFALLRDDLIIVSSERSFLDAARAARGDFRERFLDACKPLLATPHQVVCWVDAPAFSPQILPAAMWIRQVFYAALIASGNVSAGGAEFWDTILEGADQALEETRILRAGLQLDDSGVTVRVGASFRKDGRVQRYLQDIRASSKNGLRGLPDTDFLAAFSAEWSLAPGREPMQKLLTRAMVGGSGLQDQLGKEKFDQALALTDRMHDLISGSSSTIAVTGNGTLVSCGLNLTHSPKEVTELMRRGVDISGPFVMACITGLDGTVQHTTETMSDVEVDVLSIKPNEANLPMNMAIKQVYGDQPILLVAAAADGMAYAMGAAQPARKLMARVLESAAAKGGLAGNDRVRAAEKAIDAKPQAILVLDVPRLMHALMQLSRRMQGTASSPAGEGEPTTDATPYAILGMHLDPDGIRISAHMPVESLRAAGAEVRKLAKSRGQGVRRVQPVRSSPETP